MSGNEVLGKLCGDQTYRKSGQFRVLYNKELQRFVYVKEYSYDTEVKPSEL
jgi:hypothetical protein